MFSKLVRLGKDAELSTTANGKQVCKLVFVYDIGYGQNKKSVWCEGSLWGEKGNKLAPYLTKGTQIVVNATDLEPDAYQSAKGLSTKLKMNITNIELVAKGVIAVQPDVSAHTPQYAQPSPSADIPNANDYTQGGEFIDDDIPFMYLDSTFAI